MPSVSREKSAKKVHTKFKVGDIVYKLDKDNALYLISRIYEYEFKTSDGEIIDGEMINLTTGRVEEILSKFINYASSKEITDRLNEVKQKRLEYRLSNWLQEKEIVETKVDITISKNNFFFSYEFTIKAHSLGIIDCNTEFRRLNDNNNLEVMKKFRDDINQTYGKYSLKDLHFPVLAVYFPEYDIYSMLDSDKLQPKVFDENIDKKILLPANYCSKILGIIHRVLNPQMHENIYHTLGLENICSKGKGAIFLLYGPPGTGKTFTAEVIAEKIRRPLIKINIPGLMNSKELINTLKLSFEKAKQFNAVLLLDEVDVFIQRRGTHPLFDDNTAVFLRELEYYDGVLFLTTNLVNMIDPAIFSRVHACLEYSIQNNQTRKDIWKTLLHNSILNYVVGTPTQQNDMFNELSEININGREIKTAIQNAVTRAVASLNTAEIPSIRWIPKSYFIEEAKEIEQSREDLKGVN